MRNIFFCSTPYQIIVALRIQTTLLKDSTSDLYVLNHFHNVDRVVSNISQLNKYFNKVEVVKSREYEETWNINFWGRYIKRPLDMLNSTHINDKYISLLQTKYDSVYFGYYDQIIQVALKYLYKSNKDLKIHLFEDGVGAYSDRNMKVSLQKKLFNFVSKSSNLIDRYDEYLMFQPELYLGADRQLNITKIPAVTKDDTGLIDDLNNIFGFQKQDSITNKIVFFEQELSQKDYIPEAADKKVIEILEKLNKDDLTVKLHPRSNNNWYDDFYKYNVQEIPWEVVALNSNIQDKILISYFSTAAFSNKIVFDTEPYIIFLFKMEELSEYEPIRFEMEPFLKRFIQVYSDPSRIFFPKNKEELYSIINEIT